MIDSVAGMMNAPPMPMNARVAMSWSGDVASADSERAEPEDRRGRLERAACGRSGRRGCPAVSSRPANTSV